MLHSNDQCGFLLFSEPEAPSSSSFHLCYTNLKRTGASDLTQPSEISMKSLWCSQRRKMEKFSQLRPKSPHRRSEAHNRWFW